MFRLNYLAPFVLALLCAFTATDFDKQSCDLIGHWSDITLIIEGNGTTHPLSFHDEALTEDQFLKYAALIDSIYFTGHGYIEISPSATISFTKNKLSYKGHKIGRYSISKDCKDIKLPSVKIQSNPETFASCRVSHRFKDIIALEQGKNTVIYLRRDKSNPFFVGDNEDH